MPYRGMQGGERSAGSKRYELFASESTISMSSADGTAALVAAPAATAVPFGFGGDTSLPQHQI